MWKSWKVFDYLTIDWNSIWFKLVLGEKVIFFCPFSLFHSSSNQWLLREIEKFIKTWARALWRNTSARLDGVWWMKIEQQQHKQLVWNESTAGILDFSFQANVSSDEIQGVWIGSEGQVHLVAGHCGRGWPQIQIP